MDRDVSRLVWCTLVAGLLSIMLWLGSYSWILFGVLPIEDVPELRFSPWFAAEVAAIAVGLAAVLLGLALLKNLTVKERPFVWSGIALGAFAATLSSLSLLLPSA